MIKIKKTAAFFGLTVYELFLAAEDFKTSGKKKFEPKREAVTEHQLDDAMKRLDHVSGIIGSLAKQEQEHGNKDLADDLTFASTQIHSAFGFLEQAMHRIKGDKPTVKQLKDFKNKKS